MCEFLHQAQGREEEMDVYDTLLEPFTGTLHDEQIVPID